MKTRIGPLFVLGGALSFLLFNHFFGFLGHFGYDDIHYARLSNGWLNGQFLAADHFSYRFPLLALTTLSYWLFGINDFASALPSLLVTSGILFLVYRETKVMGMRIVIAALALTLLIPPFLLYTDKIMPDIYLAFFALWAFMIYVRARHSPIPLKWRTSVYFALALFFAFITKGTVVLLVPVLAVLFIQDIRLKRLRSFWYSSLLSGLIFLAIYFLGLQLFIGDALGRFSAIAAGAYESACSYHLQPFVSTLKRVGYEFLNQSLKNGLFLSALILIPFLTRARIRSVISGRSPAHLYAWIGFLMLVSSNFMTISVTGYNPMCLDPRHYLFLVPILAIPASSAAIRLIEQRLSVSVLAIISLLVLVVALQGVRTWWLLYVPLGLAYFLSVFRMGRFYLALAFLMALLLGPFDSMRHANSIAYHQQKRIVTEQVLSKFSNATIVCDPVGANIYDYWNAFGARSENTFVAYQSLASSFSSPNLIILRNWYTEWLSMKPEALLPYQFRKTPLGDSILFEDGEYGIQVIRTHSFVVPSQEKLIWSEKLEETYQFDEFSERLEYYVDDNVLGKSGDIWIEFEAEIRIPKRVNVTMVIDFDNALNESLYSSTSVTPQINIYGVWQPVVFKAYASINDLQKGAMAKLYFWIPEKAAVEVRNMQGRVYVIEGV